MTSSPFLIDAHEDLAYSALTFGRDYRRSAHEIRAAEALGDGTAEQHNGQAVLGWPDYQRGQVAVVVATLFSEPMGKGGGEWETQVYRNPAEARQTWQRQVDFYERLAGDRPDQFALVRTRADLTRVLSAWEQAPARWSEAVDEAGRPLSVTHPVGLILLMEGCEGIRAPRDMEDWWQRGLRLAGPVWAGGRFCGSNLEPGVGFTREGHELLDVLAGLGMILDLAHMSEKSALEALDRYEGTLVATHANARALLRRPDDERHLSDLTIRRLVERGGMIGLLPFSKFLRPGFFRGEDRRQTTLAHLADHVDHICQIAGDARHVGLGSDFDGGWGYPDVPYEIDTIADLGKLGTVLAGRGYSPQEVAAVLGGNWRAVLERSLPAA